MRIQGIGVVGSFGVGREALAAALNSSAPDAALVASPASELEALTRFTDKRKLRRLDPFGRLAALASFLALEDAGLGAHDCDGLALLVATSFGAAQTTFEFLDSLIEGGDRLASPTHFSQSVHNAAAANVSLLLGATGPSLTVSQFDRPFAAALSTAQSWAAEGRFTRALVGAVDARCPTLSIFFERLSQEDARHPRPRLGGGAAFLLLDARPEATGGYGPLDELLPLSAADKQALSGRCGDFPDLEALEAAAAALRLRR